MKLPAPPSGFASVLLLLALIDSLGLPSLPRTPYVHKLRAAVALGFGRFTDGRGNIEDVGKQRMRLGCQGPSRRRPVGDIAFVLGKNADGVHILRRRDENAPVEAGLLQPLVEGKPITGELISMRRREDMPFVFDVKSELPAPSAHSSDARQAARRRSRPTRTARAGTPSWAAAAALAARLAARP